jgi:hypothetical protein
VLRPMSMSCQPIGTRIEGGPHKSGRLGAADGLSLAAAPTFAVMALLTASLGGGPLESSARPRDIRLR